jgi:hypothetical protein
MAGMRTAFSVFLGIYTGAGIAGRYGVRIKVGAKSISILQNVQTGYGAHTASYSIDNGVFPGLKATGASVNHTPTSSSAITPTPP